MAANAKEEKKGGKRQTAKKTAAKKKTGGGKKVSRGKKTTGGFRWWKLLFRNGCWLFVNRKFQVFSKNQKNLRALVFTAPSSTSRYSPTTLSTSPISMLWRWGRPASRPLYRHLSWGMAA